MRPPVAVKNLLHIHRPAMRNSVFGVIIRALGGLSRTAVLLLAASHYGPTLFGHVALAMSVTEVFRTFSEFGLDTVALRHFAQATDPRKHQSVLSRLLTTKLYLATVFYGCSVIAIYTLSHSILEVELGAIASISLFSANLVGAFVSYHQSQLEDISDHLAHDLDLFLLYLAISVPLIFANAPLQLLLLVLPVSEFAYFLLLRSHSIPAKYLAFNSRHSMALLKESIPLGIMSAMIMLYTRFDNVVLYKIKGPAALGLYAASFRMVEPVLMIPGAFAISFLAVLSAKEHQAIKGSEIFGLSIRTVWPAAVLVACASATLLVFGKVLLRWLNPGYEIVYPALCTLALCLPIRAINVNLTAIINSRGAYRRLALLAGINLAMNMVLVGTLVPLFGITGAALAVLGTEIVNMVAQLKSVMTLFSDRPRLSPARNDALWRQRTTDEGRR